MMSTVPKNSLSAGNISRTPSGLTQIALHKTWPDHAPGGPVVTDGWLPWLPQIRAVPFRAIGRLLYGVKRRWRRERRRRSVGRAYDMALEIARVVPRHARVLDVGCGNGFIAHHLSALLGTSVVGLDLGVGTSAPIEYRRYGGAQFPVADHSFDAVLLCYVLHHAEDVRIVLGEIRRALRDGGCAVIYEDIPQAWLDRVVCGIHGLQWRHRTGPCTFRRESEWRSLFKSFGFEIVTERTLSRWRNLTHPVCRRFYVLKLTQRRIEKSNLASPRDR